MADLDLKEDKKENEEEDSQSKDESEEDKDEEEEEIEETKSKKDSKDDEKEEGKEDSEKKNEKQGKKKGKFRRFIQKIKDFFANPKKRLAFIISLGIILIAAVGIGVYSMSHDKTEVVKKDSAGKDVAEAPKFPAVLDGVMTDQESANRHPLAIIVENHKDARPQAGLDKASIIYEAIAEGGITRFLALYGTYEAEKVGPVRSARTYYVDWAHGFNAFFAHVGGNMDALEKIPKDKILDLDQFKYSSSYWRETRAGLASEHTMFTSTAKLRQQADKNKYSTANNFNVMKFKDDPSEADLAATLDKQKISVVFSSSEYNVDFVYDKATNSYKRSEAGKPHIDSVTKGQLNPKDIVVMTVKRSPTVTKINETGWNMTTIGSGTAQIFLDGKTIKGTWKKDSATDRNLFYDEAGNEITFNRGQLWICVIPPEGTVTVQ